MNFITFFNQHEKQVADEHGRKIWQSTARYSPEYISILHKKWMEEKAAKRVITNPEEIKNKYGSKEINKSYQKKLS